MGECQVITTVDDRKTALRIAGVLVERRLAACVQVVGPITSTYRWQGQVEIAEEWMCIAKTRDELYPDLERAILEVHPYDVPEILAMPIIAGHRPYLRWLNDSLKSGGVPL